MTEPRRQSTRTRLDWHPLQFDFASVDGERGRLGLMVAQLVPGRFVAIVFETLQDGRRGSPVLVGDRKTRAEAQRLCRNFAREWSKLPALGEGAREPIGRPDRSEDEATSGGLSSAQTLH